MTQPLRIAYLVNQYPKVSHSFIRREILALEAAGVSVERFAVRGWGDSVADPQDQLERTRTRYLLQGGIVALLLSLLRAAFSRPRRFWGALREAVHLSSGAERSLAHHFVYLAEASVLAEALRNSGAQHLHAHFGTNSAAVALLAHRLGGPGYSFTVHGPEEFDKPAAIGLARKIEASRFVVAISSFGRSQLYRWIDPSNWAKVHVVHCGLEQSFHQLSAALQDAASAKAGAARLVCVGRICEQKGQLLLVEALGLVLDQGHAVELVLAGDGDMRAAVEQRAREIGVSAHLRITGWIGSAQVRDELLGARALVLPSFAEGLPVVIMESMALARPVISTFVAGIPELVQPSRNGWLVPAGDLAALADAMVDCLTCPADELARRGQAARERVLARHDIDVEAAKLLDAFRRAVQSPAGLLT